MNSLLLAALVTVGFFAAVGLIVAWSWVAVHIENTVVAFSLFLAPFAALVFVLAYFMVEAL